MYKIVPQTQFSKTGSSIAAEFNEYWRDGDICRNGDLSPREVMAKLASEGRLPRAWITEDDHPMYEG